MHQNNIGNMQRQLREMDEELRDLDTVVRMLKQGGLSRLFKSGLLFLIEVLCYVLFFAFLAGAIYLFFYSPFAFEQELAQDPCLSAQDIVIFEWVLRIICFLGAGFFLIEGIVFRKLRVKQRLVSNMVKSLGAVQSSMKSHTEKLKSTVALMQNDQANA